MSVFFSEFMGNESQGGTNKSREQKFKVFKPLHTLSNFMVLCDSSNQSLIVQPDNSYYRELNQKSFVSRVPRRKYDTIVNI